MKFSIGRTFAVLRYAKKLNIFHWQQQNNQIIFFLLLRQSIHWIIASTHVELWSKCMNAIKDFATHSLNEKNEIYLLTMKRMLN